MSSKSRSSLLSIVVLIVLVSGLGAALYRQRVIQQEAAKKDQAVFQNLVRTIPHEPAPPPKPTQKGLKTLAMERRAEAEAARPQIAELRKQRMEIGRNWPKLTVPMLPTAKNVETVQKDYLQYRLRELEAYRQHTRDTGAAKAAGETFLERYIRQSVDRDLQTDDDKSLLALGQAVVDAGSQDPLIRTYYALCRHNVTQDNPAAIQEWEAVSDELPKTPYPPIVLSYSRLFLRDIEQDLEKRSKRWQEAVPALIAWLEDDAAHPEWLASTSRRIWLLWEQASETERNQLATACLLSSKVDPHFSHAMAGVHLHDSAWRARGAGWANDVRPQAWKRFEAELQLAATHLQYAWLLHPELPFAPERMISVAMGGSGEDSPHFWFLQTIQAQFDYYSAYRTFSNSLTSRWSGSRGELYTFAHNCVETLRFETMVPYQALEILKRVQDMELDENEALASDPEARKLLRRFLELRKAYQSDRTLPPMYENTGRYRADIVALLEDCELFAEAADVLRETGGDMNWTRLRSGNRAGRFLSVRQLALQSPLRERIQAFDEKLQTPWNGPVDPQVFDELEAELRTLRAEFGPAPDLSARVPDYFANAEVMLSHKRGFNSGEWFDLELSPNLAGWEPYADRWAMHPEKGVTLISREGNAKQIMLRPLMKFVPPLEVECDVELLGPPPFLQYTGIAWSREKELESGMLVFGLTSDIDGYEHPENPQRRDYAGIAFQPAQSKMGHLLKGTGPHRLHVKLSPEHAEYSVEDVQFTFPLKDSPHPEGWLCFGEFLPNFTRSFEQRGSVRLQNIRLRRIENSLP